MMVIFEMVATGLGDGVELVVREEFAEMTAGGSAGAKKLIIRVIHLVAAKHSLQATFVERTIVSHQRQAFDERLYLLPDIWENRSVFGVFLPQAVHAGVPIIIVVRLWLNQRIEVVDKLAVADYDYAHGTDTRGTVVSSFEIYRGKVEHFSIL